MFGILGRERHINMPWPRPLFWKPAPRGIYAQVLTSGLGTPSWLELCLNLRPGVPRLAATGTTSSCRMLDTPLNFLCPHIVNNERWNAEEEHASQNYLVGWERRANVMDIQDSGLLLKFRRLQRRRWHDDWPAPVPFSLACGAPLDTPSRVE